MSDEPDIKEVLEENAAIGFDLLETIKNHTNKHPSQIAFACLELAVILTMQHCPTRAMAKEFLNESIGVVIKEYERAEQNKEVKGESG